MDLRVYKQLEDLVKKVFDESVDPTDYVKSSEKGAANGVAELGAASLVPTDQLGAGTADATTFLRGDGTWAAAGVSDHGALAGLGDDDHTIYALLAGRAGGQTITGGTAAGEDLTLESTSNVTKGKVAVNDPLRIAGGGAEGYIDWSDGSSSPVSAANEGRMRYDNNNLAFQVSINGGAWTDLATGGGVSDLQGAYNGGNQIIVTSGTPVMPRISTGSVPTFSAATALAVVGTSSSSADATMSLIAGTLGTINLFFGDSSAESRGWIQFENVNDTILLGIGAASADASIEISSTGTLVNPTSNGSIDLRAQGQTLAYMFFLDSTSTTENIALLTTAAPNWQTMDRGIFVGDTTTAPTGNPTSGFFHWSSAGTPTWRDPAGAVFSLVQSAAYTRNATVVEDRTLLASASATTVNNNNVLAALIADLQATGILA